MAAAQSTPSTFIDLCLYSLPACLCLVAIALFFGYKSPQARLFEKLPGPRAYPLIGNLLDLPANQAEIVPVVRSWCERYPGLVHTVIGGIHYVTVSSAEAAEPVLSSKRYLDKGIDYDPVRPWLGDGLLTSTGLKWHKRRKLITPAFHFTILEAFLEVMNERATVLAARLSAAGPGGVDVRPFISDYTLDVICETAMGVSIGAQTGAGSEYKAAVHRMGHVIHERPIKPWLRNELLFRLLGWKRLQDDALAVLHSFTRSVIQTRKAQLQNGAWSSDAGGAPKKRRLAFLDLLLTSADGGEVLTDDEIREEVDTFMFEGHDTTSSGILWALYNIARFPEVQRKIHQELDKIFASGDAAPSREDLAKMRYLECTIKESMRLFPPVSIFSRTLREPTLMIGYEVPAGTDVFFFPHMIHRDQRHWPEPERFDPDRFLPERTAARHPYSYVPFSAGPRNCIGQRFALMEEKAAISALLRRFRLETRQPYDESMLNVSLTLQTTGPVLIQFAPRQSG